MRDTWPVAPLGAVIRQRKEVVRIDDSKVYRRCRVQLHAKGIILRDLILGAQIRTKEQQICHSRELLVAEIDAKVGGFGVVPPELEGAIVSSHYFLFQLDQSQLDWRFLDYYLRTPIFRDQVIAQGSTNYASIRPQNVQAYTVPLPPLSEQQRIVTRIGELGTKIEEANHLRKQAARAAAALLDSAMNTLLSQSDRNSSWRLGPIEGFAEVNPRRVGNPALLPDDLVSFIPMKAVDDVTGTITCPETRAYDEVARGYTWFKDSDVIFARITPCMQNGKAAIARNLVNGMGFGSTEFHVIRPGPQITPDWLHAIVRHKAFRDDAAAHFKGTAGQQRVPQSFIAQKEIPVPPLSEQHRIITHMNGLAAMVDELRTLQDRTAGELDALLPSLLDRAFRGGL